MSFDEMKHLNNDEIDLAHLFKIIWSYKYLLLMFVMLSIPISIILSNTLKPRYKAETVFEKPVVKNNQSSSILNNAEGFGFLSILGGGLTSGNGDSFFSEIRSESFLKTVIFNNARLDYNMLQEFCPLPSKETSRFSLRSLLISLGISENKTPSKSQKKSLLVKCVNDMLGIDFDTYGSKNKSSAYRLSIESGDPNFSANLANQIVEKYFIRHEKVKDQDFQNVKKYLSKVINEAQQELTEANKLIQSFKIKHTLLMDIMPLPPQNTNLIAGGGGFPIPQSPFLPELNKEIANLSQLEKSLNELKKASLSLSKLKGLNQEEIKIFISSTEVQGALSRTFVTAISKMNNLPAGISVINQELRKIVNQELQRLNQQIKALEEKIDEREEQTRKLMVIENRFQELSIDVSKKKLIFEGLKDQLKEKILTTGLANVDQPILLSRAVPPFRKAFPNKTIYGFGIVLSLFAGIGYILIRQNSLRRVHSLSQLQKISRFLSCYEISYKQLKQMDERPDGTVMGQSFFSHAMEIGKLGCIIDLSQKRQNNSLASEFSKTTAVLFAKNNSKIVCLNASFSKKPFYSNTQKNLESDQSNLNVRETVNKNISLFNDDDGIISAGEIEKIKNKYSDYDKIICALGTDVGDLTKFKFIEKCDFYILIGRSFHFDEYTYKRFSNTVWEKEKKCLGFFLID